MAMPAMDGTTVIGNGKLWRWGLNIPRVGSFRFRTFLCLAPFRAISTWSPFCTVLLHQSVPHLPALPARSVPSRVPFVLFSHSHHDFTPRCMCRLLFLFRVYIHWSASDLHTKCTVALRPARSESQPHAHPSPPGYIMSLPWSPRRSSMRSEARPMGSGGRRQSSHSLGRPGAQAPPPQHSPPLAVRGATIHIHSLSFSRYNLPASGL